MHLKQQIELGLNAYWHLWNSDAYFIKSYFAFLSNNWKINKIYNDCNYCQSMLWLWLIT